MNEIFVFIKCRTLSIPLTGPCPQVEPFCFFLCLQKLRLSLYFDTFTQNPQLEVSNGGKKFQIAIWLHHS